MTSYCAMISTDGDSYATNALRFKTETEAHEYACELASRWLAVVDFKIEDREDPITYVMTEGKAVSIRGEPHTIVPSSISDAVTKAADPVSTKAVPLPEGVTVINLDDDMEVVHKAIGKALGI